MILHRLSILSIICACVLLSATPAHALKSHGRADQNWLVGVSWGIGQAHYTSGTGDEATLKRGAAPQIRFGYLVSTHFLAAFEYEGWLFEEGDVTEKVRRSFQAATIALSWFPGGDRPGWGGLYLRAGAGIGWGGVAHVDLVPDEEGELIQTNSRRTDESGLGLVFGVGYEFRLARQFSAGLAITASHLSLQAENYESAWTLPLTMTLGWYW